MPLLAAAFACPGVGVGAQAPSGSNSGLSASSQSALEVQDILVTATRRSTSLQDVPMVVTPITDEDLQKFNITTFNDIATLSPGLQLSPANSRLGAVASLRGVGFTITTGSQPAVDIYFNETQLNAIVAFQSIYDIGQIEVLRGPQGTLRGAPAPTGAITIATRRPDLDEIGGMADATIAERGNLNLQSAINIPLLAGRAAVRLAGMYDKNDGGDISNPTTGAESDDRTRSARASVVLEPTNNLELFASYQYLRNKSESLTQVEGAGLGYNGPLIRGGDRLAVQEVTSPGRLTSHIVNWSAKLDLEDVTLSYIGGYQQSLGGSTRILGDQDAGNAIVDAAVGSSSRVPQKSRIHELRLDSSGEGRFWDFTLGAYSFVGSSKATRQTRFVSAFPGAYGDPATTSGPPRGPLNERYLLAFDLILPVETQSRSIFGSSTFHLPTGTDITVGARHIWFRDERNFSLAFRPSHVAVPLGFPTAGVCTSLGMEPSVYSTSCDATVELPARQQDAVRKQQAWVYNANVTHHLSDNTTVYANYGHSWRPPGSNQGTNVPDEVFWVDAEKSDNYEIGVKAEFLDRRVRLGAAVFQQDFKNFISRVANVPYLQGAGTPFATVGIDDVTINGDARVRGFEVEVFGQLTEHWTAQASLSYAKGRFKDANIPCRDSNFDGIADNGADPTVSEFENAGTVIAYCRSNGPISTLPEWSATLSSEYVWPIGQADAYLRGLATYYGTNKAAKPGEVFDDYVLLNVFAGAREIIPGLDISFFVKNVFNVTNTIDRTAPLTTFGLPTGYVSATYTPPRRVGATARYAFGGG